MDVPVYPRWRGEHSKKIYLHINELSHKNNLPTYKQQIYLFKERSTY
ncbi:hypothetical protein CIT292_09828 [Citrobacter youngae ATCC 29220]|uniref:Uncharacterized protein n=1 Tax=Citrobacter youngae ATCC 29220 TaxID=500640 RepID=D4BH21_9ENTR|nr:hypothetical protein CIT292_09828 [Citrobacter youngae ATCC 29220]